MQNSDGRWGAFDLNNDRLFLNNIPFSDMDSLCDPSTADVTGRILEAYGLVFKHTKHAYNDETLLKRMDSAFQHGIEYLQSVQETTRCLVRAMGIKLHIRYKQRPLRLRVL